MKMKVSIRDYFRLRLYDVLTTGGLSVRARVDEFVGGLESEGLLGDCEKSWYERAQEDVLAKFKKYPATINECSDQTSTGHSDVELAKAWAEICKRELEGDEFQKSGDFEGGDVVDWEDVFDEMCFLVVEDGVSVTERSETDSNTKVFSIEWDGVEVYRQEFEGKVDYKELVSYIINFFLVHKKMIAESTKDKSGDNEIIKGVYSYIESGDGEVNWGSVFNQLCTELNFDWAECSIKKEDGLNRFRIIVKDNDNRNGTVVLSNSFTGDIDYKSILLDLFTEFLVERKDNIYPSKGGRFDGSKTNPFRYDEVGQSSPAVLLTPEALLERGFEQINRDTYKSDDLAFRFTNVGVELIFKTPSGKFDIIGRYDGGIPENAAMVLYGALRYHTLESISTLMSKGVSIPQKMKVEDIPNAFPEEGSPYSNDVSEEDFEVVDRNSSPLEDEIESLSDKLTDVEISLKSLSQRFSKLKRIDIYTELQSIIKSM
jgi:hypothetical protein